MATDPETTGGLTATERERALARLDPLRERLDQAKTTQADVLAERAELLLQLSEDGVASVREIAARAGISDAAVVQQQAKARQARQKQQEATA